MKKVFLLFIFYFLFHASSFAQVEIEWQKNFGGSNFDYLSSVMQTSDNGYIAAGYSASNDGDVSGNHGLQDYWLVKTDSIGNLQWQKCFGGSSYDWGNAVQQTSDGGYIIAGYTESNDGDVTGNHGASDYWLVKTDNLGNLQWQKYFGGSNGEMAKSVQQTSDGGYILAGHSDSNDGDVTGNQGGSDYWIVKTDGNGNLQWQKCLGGTSYDYGSFIRQTSGGGYIATGYASSVDGDVSGNHGGYDYWVIKTDSIGNLQWQKCLGGAADDHGAFILETLDGGYITTGLTYSNNGDVSGNHGNSDSWVAKLDSTGNIQWQKCYGGTIHEGFSSIQQSSDNGYICSGTTISKNGDVSGNHGQFDYWLVRTDSIGNLQWQKCFGGSADDYVFSMQQTSDGEYIVAGYTQSNDGDVAGTNGSSDYWLVKLTDNYNSITGKLFIDANSNAVQDTGEVLVNNKQVTELNTGRFNFSNQDGEYLVSVLDSGNFIVIPAPVNYYNPVPVNQPAYFAGIQQTDSLNDFAFQPAGVFNDLCITITPIGPFRAGFNASYMINYENVGTTTLSPTVIFFTDNDVTYVSANPVANSVTADSIVWNFGPLAPYQTGNILVTVNVNLGTPIGTLINSSVEIDPVTGDANTACNYHAWEVFVTGAVDPNAILVDRDTVFTPELSNPPYLNYIIYFQNTGNDTAFNARVLNNIPQRLDIGTFEFVASSHPVNITYGAHSRLFTFTFDNILLPDSNVNEPASHGFIRYRIKPKSNLVAGNKIFNKAFIYFDFNEPVQTNNAVTEIVLPTGVGELAVGSGSKQLIVFPNPADQTITIASSLMTNDQYQISIYDLFGRKVYEQKPETFNQKPETAINVSAFSKGVYFIQVGEGNTFYRTKFVKM